MALISRPSPFSVMCSQSPAQRMTELSMPSGALGAYGPKRILPCTFSKAPSASNEYWVALSSGRIPLAPQNCGAARGAPASPILNYTQIAFVRGNIRSKEGQVKGLKRTRRGHVNGFDDQISSAEAVLCRKNHAEFIRDFHLSDFAALKAPYGARP